ILGHAQGVSNLYIEPGFAITDSNFTPGLIRIHSLTTTGSQATVYNPPWYVETTGLPSNKKGNIRLTSLAVITDWLQSFTGHCNIRMNTSDLSAVNSMTLGPPPVSLHGSGGLKVHGNCNYSTPLTWTEQGVPGANGTILLEGWIKFATPSALTYTETSASRSPESAIINGAPNKSNIRMSGVADDHEPKTVVL